MSVDVVPAEEQERPIIEGLMDGYLAELSRFREVAVGATDAASYPFLELYWSKKDRHPFILRANGELVGFALIRRIVTPAHEMMQVAEFFVLPKYRRQGLGTAAALALWKQFPGRWELQVMKSNEAATSFWTNCIGTHAKEGWEVEEIEAKDGSRYFYHFLFK